ncbi:hypothetical protein [Mycobacterium sp. C31M]
MNRIAAAAVTFIGYTVVMVRLDRRMQATGGPGIVPFELAGTVAKAEDFMDRWGPDGRRTARRSIWLDFGYMTSYGILLGLLVDRRRRHRGHPAWLPTLAAGAVTADAIEGVALLRVLDRRDIAASARTAQVAASIKFTLIAVALGYVGLPARSTG